MPHLALMLGLFTGSTTSSLVATFTLFAMIGEVNRKKEEHAQISYFHFSWVRVLREYRSLYPKGIYTKVLYVATGLTCVFFFAFGYLLFGVLPKYALPSR